jgi:hypothetical protein
LIARAMGIAVVLILVIVADSLSSQEIATSATQAYQLRPIGARAAAFSGMQVACADDPTALFSNPACIGYLIDKQLITGGVTMLSMGRSLSNVAATFDIGDAISLGTGIVGYDAGTLVRRDANGTALGTNTVWQGFATIGASARLNTQTSIGVAGRIAYSSAPDPASTGSGAAVDVGFITSLLDVATFGASIQNLGTMKFGTEQIALPWIVRVGVCSYVPFAEEVVETTSPTLGTTDTVTIPSRERVLFGIEAQQRAGATTPTIIAGFEVVPHPLFAIRGGMAIYGEELGKPRLFPATLLSGGISVWLTPLYPLRLDYALARGFTAQFVHTLSLVADL